MEIEKRVSLALAGLKNLYGDKFGKKRNVNKHNKSILYRKLVETISMLFNKYQYTPISRLPDIMYYMQVLDSIYQAIFEDKTSSIDKLIEWSNNVGLKINENDPFDLIRLILDSSVEVCVGLTYMYSKRPSEYSSDLKEKIGVLSFEGYCDMLRGISDLTATQFHHEYLFHLKKVVEDLYAYSRRKELSLQQILRLNKAELEKFRVFVTSKFEPVSKAFLLQVMLSKIHWPILFLLESRDVKGIAARKPIEPSYIGRITSEVLDAMMYRYYDETVVHGYDVIIKNYFDVLREVAIMIENKASIGYLETLPSIRSMEDEVNRVINNNLSNIAAQYFKRRGILRLGEVRQDVKDYVLQLYYLYNEAKSIGVEIQLDSIVRYDLVRLVTTNTLEIKS